MKIIPNWKKCWRMFSFQADAIPVAFAGVWQLMPAELRQSVPQDWLLYSAIGFFILGMVGRLINQEKTK